MKLLEAAYDGFIFGLAAALGMSVFMGLFTAFLALIGPDQGGVEFWWGGDTVVESDID